MAKVSAIFLFLAIGVLTKYVESRTVQLPEAINLMKVEYERIELLAIFLNESLNSRRDIPRYLVFKVTKDEKSLSEYCIRRVKSVIHRIELAIHYSSKSLEMIEKMNSEVKTWIETVEQMSEASLQWHKEEILAEYQIKKQILFKNEMTLRKLGSEIPTITVNDESSFIHSAQCLDDSQQASEYFLSKFVTTN